MELVQEPPKPVPDEKWLAEISAKVTAIPPVTEPDVPPVAETAKPPEHLSSTDERFEKLVKWVIATDATALQVTNFLIEKGLYIEASQETHLAELRKLRAKFIEGKQTQNKAGMSISEIVAQNIVGDTERAAFNALNASLKK